MAVLEGAFFAGLAPKDLVVAVGVEGRVDVDEVHGGVGEVGPPEAVGGAVVAVEVGADGPLLPDDAAEAVEDLLRRAFRGVSAGYCNAARAGVL